MYYLLTLLVRDRLVCQCGPELENDSESDVVSCPLAGTCSMLLTGISLAVNDWQTGNGGFKIGLWSVCFKDTGCRTSKLSQCCDHTRG